jgi:hypothetical protein
MSDLIAAQSGRIGETGPLEAPQERKFSVKQCDDVAIKRIDEPRDAR